MLGDPEHLDREHLAFVAGLKRATDGAAVDDAARI